MKKTTKTSLLVIGNFEKDIFNYGKIINSPLNRFKYETYEINDRVDTATDYGLDDRGAGVRVSVGTVKNFLFSTLSRPARVHTNSYRRLGEGGILTSS
jgi:hypothetical protein